MNPHKDQHLVRLGRLLKEQNYEFVTVTPDTHLRILARGERAKTVRDIFGWNKIFLPNVLPPSLLACLRDAGEIEDHDDGLRSRIRAATLASQLFLHSSFPTSAEDAVFVGPDSYRFARLIEQALQSIDISRLRHATDIGCGSGVGGIAIRRLIGDDVEITLSDVNENALRFARLNCKINDLSNIEVRRGDVLQGLPGHLDLIVSNPPYLIDPTRRLYRHGGGTHGFDLSVRIVAESIQHLRPGGRLVLYTGTAIIDGRDLLREALRGVLASPNLHSNYSEVDPDVFGTELEGGPYHSADRIAVVALQLTKG